MYFFDTFDFAFPKGSTQANIWIKHLDLWHTHYYMNDFVFVNNPDGTLGVYYDSDLFTGMTTNIQNFSSQVNEEYCTMLSKKFDESRNELISKYYDGYNQLPECYRLSPLWNDDTCASERFATYFQTYVYKNTPNCYWDENRGACATKQHPLETCLDDCGDDCTIDFNQLLTQPLSAVTTVEEFDYYLSSELIDVKSRKTLSGYPTLRALYDRYTNSTDYCTTTSSAFDYTQIDKFASLIDSYWVDIVEQVIPATTIWGSVKVYGNTIFDQQKFQYKKGSLFTCTETCPDLDDVNACLFKLIEKFYLKKSDSCHTNVCYQKGYGNIDFLDDLSQMPTSDQIRSWGATQCGCNYTNLASVTDAHTRATTVFEVTAADLRTNRDILKQQTVDYSSNLMNGYCDGDSNVITPDSSLVSYASYPNEFMYLGKPVMIKINSGAKASTMTGWTGTTDPIHGKTLKQIYSAYTDDFNYVRSVPDFASLPTIGNGGDIIRVHNGGYPNYEDYAWDPISNSWSILMYNFIENEILVARRQVRDAHIKAKRELLLAIRPFTWSNYHLLLHPIKLWVLQDAPILTGNDIITSATDITPCSYVKTADPCVLLPFCGPYKYIYNAQC